jgi:hypothetical protein
MDTLVILLVLFLTVLAPFLIGIAIPAFFVWRVVQFCKTHDRGPRKTLVIIGSVIAVWVFLILGLFTGQALSGGILKTWSSHYTDDETTYTGESNKVLDATSL